MAELLQNNKDQIVGYHEHDSLLDHKEEEALSEEDRKAAWAEYEAEKKVGCEKCVMDSTDFGLKHIPSVTIRVVSLSVHHSLDPWPWVQSSPSQSPL